MHSTRDPSPEIRRAQRVLLMVHELHKRGYQRLRVVPGMSPSGVYWRCSVTPITNTLTTHGALFQDFERDVALYTTGMDNRYFDWPDAEQDTARQLASKFVERFPSIAEEGLGRDWVYAGWYVEMLGLAEQGCLPIAYSDWDYGEEHHWGIPTMCSSHAPRELYGARLPMPPPGEALSRGANLVAEVAICWPPTGPVRLSWSAIIGAGSHNG
jgi:hypothetical protein